jgi:hypothetical protein
MVRLEQFSIQITAYSEEVVGALNQDSMLNGDPRPQQSDVCCINRWRYCTVRKGARVNQTVHGSRPNSTMFSGIERESNWLKWGANRNLILPCEPSIVEQHSVDTLGGRQFS